jgi:hypothetical protein
MAGAAGKSIKIFKQFLTKARPRRFFAYEQIMVLSESNSSAQVKFEIALFHSLRNVASVIKTGLLCVYAWILSH